LYVSDKDKRKTDNNVENISIISSDVDKGKSKTDNDIENISVVSSDLDKNINKTNHDVENIFVVSSYIGKIQNVYKNLEFRKEFVKIFNVI